ncbi:sirohydrochlorin chelatase [Aquibacillus rhizosphaerae]|uniref:Sirohydrochlorin chelatase n=1 Tax=Aquibacillus rhizosphaerae TaxID=3051431 RepID=A0ABT7L8R1_9BACI|nr:sirohydrochlorin chelatase [Aquibacillus sp. LR5S19]MDL4842243.1 sirohydrochlorin chelatase [Aquibacillus sp. LR5S19]
MIIIQAVLYICHGSRMKEAAQEAIDFVEKTMKLVDTPIQEYCFLELASPSILEGVDQCVKQGASKIAVIPVLLLTAGHAKKDIPEELERAQKVYNQVEFTYGKPLGVQEKMIDVLAERMKEQREPTPDINVLLVGRGSSDQEAVNDMKKIAGMLEKKVDVSVVNTCFLAASTPKFEEMLRSTAAFGAERIVILPYLLFTGVLMTEIREFVDKLRINPEQEIIICDYLGSHLNVCELLKDRVMEAIGEGEKVAAMA